MPQDLETTNNTSLHYINVRVQFTGTPWELKQETEISSACGIKMAATEPKSTQQDEQGSSVQTQNLQTTLGINYRMTLCIRYHNHGKQW